MGEYNFDYMSDTVYPCIYLLSQYDILLVFTPANLLTLTHPVLDLIVCVIYVLL